MKIVSILFLSIVFLAIIGILLTVGREEKVVATLKIVILDIALVILGFSLAVVWDVIKDARQENAERQSIILMLQSELGEMHAGINTNLDTVNANLQALETSKEVVRPLIFLQTSAWESAKIRNNIFIKNTDDLFKLVNLYSAVHVVNEKIRFRDNYRMSNQAMTNYNDRLKIIDSDIKQALEKLREFHSIAQEYIHRDYPMVVKGYSFALDQGRVKKAK
ncbi:MAG: hypothetical protein WC738_04455 [Candidatus Omnitrophota bacterium]|jgi:hypothetical protein